MRVGETHGDASTGFGERVDARDARERVDARAGVIARAGEALDWENDDFVPAGKQKKNKKVPKAQTQKAPSVKGKPGGGRRRWARWRPRRRRWIGRMMILCRRAR